MAPFFQSGIGHIQYWPYPEQVNRSESDAVALRQVNGLRLRQERVDQMVGHEIVLLLKAGVRDARHHIELLV